MTTSLDLHVITRKNIVSLVKDLDLETINDIPVGFTGNIAWHIGHVVSSSQGLLYRLSGLDVKLPQTFVDKYKKGSVPESPISADDFTFILQQLISQTEQLKSDIESGIFKTYNPYTTSYGNTIHNFDEALSFVNVHEALHMGYIMALKRVVC